MKKTLLLLLAASSFSIAALSCAGTSVSQACTTDRDCEPGQSCFLSGFPGGFCTRGCTREGQVGTECPGSSICTATVASSGTLFCSNECTDNTQCREGYTCRAQPSGSKKACAP